MQGLFHGLLGAHALQHGVGQHAAEQFADLCDAVVPAFGDDVRGPELAGDRLAVGVAGHRDDPLGAQALGRQDAAEPDGAVADHHDGPAGAGLARERGVVAGGHDVGERQQAGAQRFVRARSTPGTLTSVRFGERDADGLALAAVDREAGVVLAAPAGEVVAGDRDAVEALRARPRS